MSKMAKRLIKKLNEREAKIEQLEFSNGYLLGRLDCSRGLPAKSDDAAYQEGYAEQYAIEYKNTQEILEEML